MEIGKLFFESLYRGDTNLDILIFSNIDDSFFYGYSKDLYNFLITHKRKFGKLPSKDTINNEIKLPDFNKFNDSGTSEKTEYYLEKIVKRKELNTISEALNESVKILERSKTTNESIDGILKVFSSTTQRIKNERYKNEGKILNLKDDIEKRIDRYCTVKNKSDKIQGFHTPWEFLDLCTFGTGDSQYWVIVARPGTGKTFSSLLFFEHIRRQSSKDPKKRPPLFISMEMSVDEICLRADAMRYQLPNTFFRLGSLTTNQETNFFESLSKKEGSDHWIVGNDAVNNLGDIEDIISTYNPGAVIIDSMWLIENDLSDEFKRMTRLSRDIKKIVKRRKIPIICTAQLNREGDVALADAIKQDVNVLIKMSMTNEMEQNNQMMFSLLKVRDGLSGKNFVTYWNHEYTNYDFISECDENGNFITSHGKTKY